MYIVSLGIYIPLRFWNGRKHKVRKGHKPYERTHTLIATRLAEDEDERLRLLIAQEPATAKALKARPPIYPPRYMASRLLMAKRPQKV